MTNETKTKIGHNSNTEYREGGAMTDTIMFLHNALDDAITLIISQTKRNNKVEKHLKSAVFAKNNLQRGVHLSKATAQVCKNKAEVENFDNVIYSYPFYSKNDIDYEYRVTISEEELLVEQVKCDDSKTDFNDSVEVFSEVFRGTLDEGFDLITKNIDIRDRKSILQEGIIDYDFQNCASVEKLKEKIELNKISVLFELYKEIIDSVFE